MRDDMMNVLDLLTEQHAEVDELFEKLEGDRGDKAALFVELADKLAAHATIEEKIFYPGVMSDEHEDVLREAVEEHLAMKRVLADMLDLDLDIQEDEKIFDAKLSVLKEQVSHHAHEEEEDELFPKLRRELDADVLAALGNECMAMFEQLIEREPRRALPSETIEAAPLPSP